jgi:hypothetical protein
MLIYYIPPPCKHKWCRQALLSAQLWCQYQSRKHDNHDGGDDSSSPSTKLQAMLIRFKEWLSAGIIHVKAIIGLSELMNERHPIPLPHAKLAKKNDCTTIDGSTCLGRLIPLFWVVLCSCMLLISNFWMIKFIGVMLASKEELMAVNNNGDENYAPTVKWEACAWKKWARWQFQCRAVINLHFCLIDWEGSMVWSRRKKKLL